MNTYICIEKWKPVYRWDRGYREKCIKYGWVEDELTSYEVSNFGRVKKDGRLIELKLGIGNYYQIVDENIPNFGMLHRWVAEAFLYDSVNRPSGYENVHHIDEDKLNNHVSNLMFCSKAKHLDIHKKKRTVKEVKEMYYV